MMHELKDSSGLVDNPTALRERLIEDGYLYLSNWLGRDVFDGVISDLQAGLAKIGWLDDPSTLELQSYGRTFTGDSYANGYASVQRVESFHQMSHNEALMRLMRDVLQTDVFCHPAHVCRVAFPKDDQTVYSTRPHQDFSALHVCSDVLTAWIPLCPCDEQRPGLQVIPRSHRNGYIRTDPLVGGTRPLYINVPADAPDWATARYKVGDVLVLHCLLIHAALVNRSHAVRLSVDFRYQPVQDPIREEYLHPHGYPRTPDWAKLTEGWSSREWIEVPASVRVEPFPAGVDFADYVATLKAPRSQLLQLEW